jgi:hypothetical protein
MNPTHAALHFGMMFLPKILFVVAFTDALGTKWLSPFAVACDEMVKRVQ